MLIWIRIANNFHHLPKYFALFWLSAWTTQDADTLMCLKNTFNLRAVRIKSWICFWYIDVVYCELFYFVTPNTTNTVYSKIQSFPITGCGWTHYNFDNVQCPCEHFTLPLLNENWNLLRNSFLKNFWICQECIKFVTTIIFDSIFFKYDDSDECEH